MDPLSLGMFQNASPAGGLFGLSGQMGQTAMGQTNDPLEGLFGGDQTQNTAMTMIGGTGQDAMGMMYMAMSQMYTMMTSMFQSMMAMFSQMGLGTGTGALTGGTDALLSPANANLSAMSMMGNPSNMNFGVQSGALSALSIPDMGQGSFLGSSLQWAQGLLQEDQARKAALAAQQQTQQTSQPTNSNTSAQTSPNATPAPSASPAPFAANASAEGFIAPLADGTYSLGDGLGAGRNHGGQDMPANEGDPVMAAKAGKIVEVSVDPEGWGNYVTIEHDGGIKTRYAHLSAYGEYQVGETVNAGDIVGKVGSTGRSTGPHLHFEMLAADGSKMEPTDHVHL